MLTSILHLTPTKKQSIYISGPLSNLEHKASETLTSQIILEASTLYSPAYYYRLLRLCDPKRFQKKIRPFNYTYMFHISRFLQNHLKTTLFLPRNMWKPARFSFPFLFVKRPTAPNVQRKTATQLSWPEGVGGLALVGTWRIIQGGPRIELSTGGYKHPKKWPNIKG